ncbi:unnamed protein product [Closterium sp. NIES-53]
MALLRVLPFDPEGRPVAFDTCHDDLQLYLLSDIRDSVSLFDHVSGAAPAPPATADVSTRSQWLSCDATARLAIRNHLPATECAHFGEHRTALALYDAVVARYSSPTTTALGRLLLPYLFPELSAFATIADLVTHLRTSDARYRATIPAEFLPTNQPPMFVTLYFIVICLPDSLRSVRNHFLTLDPTSLTVDLLEQHLLAAETSVVATSLFLRTSVLLRLVRSTATARARVAGVVEEAAVVVEVAVGVVAGAAVEQAEAVEVVAAMGPVAEVEALVATVAAAEEVAAVEAVGPVVVGLDLSVEALVVVGASSSSVGARLKHPSSSVPVRARHAGYFTLSAVALPALTTPGVLSLVMTSSAIAGRSCLGIAAASLGASVSVTPPGTAPAEALHTFTLDSGASRCFFRDSTTLIPLPALVPVRQADPSGGPVLASSSTVLPCPAVPSGSLTGLHLPSFSTNLVSTAALQDAMVTTTTPGGSSLYTLATEPPQVAASAQVSASGHVAASCSCRLLSHQTLLWHHRLGHPSLPRLRGMHSRLLVSGLPRSLPPLPPSPAPPCLPCVEGRQRAAPHSSSFPPTTAPLQTLHMDVWGPARVSGQGRERYFLLVVDDYTRYTTVFPLRSKGEVSAVLNPWIRTVRLQLRERFGQDLPVLRLHSDRGGEFSSDLLRDFCRGEGITQSFTLPDSPQQNGIAKRRIGLVMEVARTSMIHAAAPHFLWPFAVRYAAHQLNLWPRVSLPETSPTLCWTGKVGDASVFWVWGSRAFVRDTSADKLSARAIPYVFLGFVPDAPGWQFYHPTLRRVLPSQDVTFDKSAPFYRLFPYRSAPPPPPPLFLAPDPLLGTAPVQVAVVPGAAPGAASGGAASGGAASGGAEPEGAGSEGAGSGRAEPEGVEPKGAESEGTEPGGPAGASPRLSLQQLREWLVQCPHRRRGAPGASEPRDAGAGGAAVTTGAGDPTEPGAAGAGAGVAGVGGPGVGGARAAGAGVVDPGAGGAGGTVRPRPYFVPLLQQVLGVPSSTGLPPPYLCPPTDQSQPPLQPASQLPVPSPYTEQSGGLTERREPTSRPVSPVRTTRRAPRSRPPPVPGTHTKALRPSSVPLRVPLPAPPESSFPEVPDPESDRAHAASPTVARLLATAVTDPSFESAAASALIAELLDFAAACRLDYTTALVAGSVFASPPSVRGTYVDEAPPPGVNIFNGMWIFRVKRPPGSSPAFMACYVARGFSQREGVDFFQTFSPTLKMTSLWVLVHVAAQHDYELHSLDFSTAFLQGSLHEEIWLRRLPGFTGSYLAGTQWSLRRPVYGLRQEPREWHDTLRTTLAALGFVPSTADPSLFLRTNTSLPRFYVLMYVDKLVFATTDTEALTLVKSELQKRHTCTDLGELRSYLGLQITWHRARRTITLTQSHMVHQVLQRFGFQYSSPQLTPLSTSHFLSAPPSDESVEPSGPYLELVGCFMYLMTCTRPDLAYPLSLLARYVTPGRHQKVHWDAAKRVLRYLCSTSGMGLVLGGRGPDGCSPSLVAPSYASAAAVDILGTEDVGTASALTGKRSSSKCKGGKSGGGGRGGGGGGGSGGSGGGGGGDSTGSGGGGGCFGGGDGGSSGGGGGGGGGSGSGGGGSGSGRGAAAQRGGIEAAALGASESTLTGTVPAEALPTFTLDSSASRCFFRDSTTLTPLPAPIPVFTFPHSLRTWSGSSPLLVSPPVAPDSPVAPPPPCHAFVACTPASFFLVFLGVCLPSRPRLPRPAFLASRGVHLQLRERLREDLPVLRLHSGRGGEFSSDLLRDFCREEGILKSFTLPASPQQNGVAERRIGLVIETSPTLRWTGKVGDASMFRVWGSRAFVRDTSADKLSSRAIPCVFLGFPLDEPGWQFYHPTSRRVLPSQDVTFDESIPFYCVSQIDPILGTVPVEVAVDSGVARGAASRGATSGGAASGGAEPASAEPGGAEPEGAESGGVEPGGAVPGGTEREGAEPGGTESEGAESGGAEPRSTASAGGPAGASPRLSPRWEPFSPQELREWLAQRTRLGSGAAGAGGSAAGGTGAGGAGATSLGGAGVTARAGSIGGTGAAGLGGARTRAGGAGAGDPGSGGAGAGGTSAGGTGAGASRAGGTGAGGAGAGGAGAGDPGAGGAGAGASGAGGTGARGAGAGGAGAGDPGAAGAGAEGTGVGGARASSLGTGGTVQRRSFSVPSPPLSLPPPDTVLRHILSLPSPTHLPPSLLIPPPHQSQPQLQPDSPLPAPSPYAEQTDSFTERPEPESRPASPVRAVRTGRRIPRPRPPPVPGTHIMALRSGAGGTGAGGAGAGGTRAGDPGARGASAGGAGSSGPGAGGTVQWCPFFVPPPLSSLSPLDSVLRQVLSLPSSTGLTPSLLSPPPHLSQPQLQPDSPLPAPSPYAEQTDYFTERREPESGPALPVRAVRTGRRVPRPRPPPVPGTHIMALRPSSVPLRVPLPSPHASSLADGLDPESDLARAASPTVPRLLPTVVTDPSFESTAASALVSELVDFAAVCLLDYATSLVVESESDCPPSVGGECAIGMDVLEDRQEDFEYLATAVPHLVAMLLAPEGDPDAPDIPTPRSYAEAITGTYVDAVSPCGVNIVDGMWIFRVTRSPCSPLVFKARYVARGLSQRHGDDFFHTFSPTPKMTALRVLLHVAARRDYELHSLDFNTTFLQGSLHEEIWLRRPPGFTWSFPAGTQWSLRRPVYSLRQAPREWHDTLRTTLAALGFAPSTTDPSLFLRTDTLLPPFYVLVYFDDLVFATADTEALALEKSELHKRHTCV